MKHIRAQLIAFTAFAADTPDPNPQHNMLWWAGELPATPSTYPLSWPDREPLFLAVMRYLERLVHAARKHTWAKEYLQKLCNCQFADLYTWLEIDVSELDLVT